VDWDCYVSLYWLKISTSTAANDTSGQHPPRLHNTPAMLLCAACMHAQGLGVRGPFSVCGGAFWTSGGGGGHSTGGNSAKAVGLRHHDEGRRQFSLWLRHNHVLWQAAKRQRVSIDSASTTTLVAFVEEKSLQQVNVLTS